MPKIGVVTDSTADFPSGVQQDFGIRVVPLSVIWDGNQFRDKIDLSTADFYTMLPTRSSIPTTSAPPAGLYESVYAELLQEVDHVISVHLAGKLSATADVARTAAARVGQGRVTVIDSGQTTMGLGWLAARAAEMAADDAAVDRIVDELHGWIPRLRLYAVLDTLEYLKKGGRIGRAQAFVGALLNIKPIISLRDGEVHPVERVRSRSAGMRRLVDLVASQLPVGGVGTRLGILQGGAPDVLDELERLFTERLPAVRLERSEIGIVLGTHTGPGVFGACYLLPA